MKNRKVLLTLFIVLIAGISIVFQSCSDDSNPSAPPDPVTQTLIHLDSSYAIGGRALVSIYLEDSLHTGYNKVYIVLHDSVTNAVITDAHVEFTNINHGSNAPVENPASTAVDGKFAGAWIPTASQAVTDHWHYHIMVHNHQAPGKPEGEAEFGDFVVRDWPEKFKSFTMPDSTKLYLSYITPTSPIVGLNDFEFMISRNEPETYPPDGSYSVVVNPVFLADGHTTSNNVNPTGTSDGHYKGKVNFDRSGSWRINLRLSKNGMLYDTYFETTF